MVAQGSEWGKEREGASALTWFVIQQKEGVAARQKIGESSRSCGRSEFGFFQYDLTDGRERCVNTKSTEGRGGGGGERDGARAAPPEPMEASAHRGTTTKKGCEKKQLGRGNGGWWEWESARTKACTLERGRGEEERKGHSNSDRKGRERLRERKKGGERGKRRKEAKRQHEESNSPRCCCRSLQPCSACPPLVVAHEGVLSGQQFEETVALLPLRLCCRVAGLHGEGSEERIVGRRRVARRSDEVGARPGAAG